jgi:nitrite reductase/ring-hydroxylating ferredoxin subunit
MCFKALLGVCKTKPLSDDLWSLEENKVHVKLSQMPAPLSEDGAVYLKGKGLGKPVLIVKTEEGQYLAFENSCTHGGRKLDPVPGESKLRCCSIGHSTFDYEGNKLSGMAKGPLTRYGVEESGGDLIVTL